MSTLLDSVGSGSRGRFRELERHWPALLAWLGVAPPVLESSDLGSCCARPRWFLHELKSTRAAGRRRLFVDVTRNVLTRAWRGWGSLAPQLRRVAALVRLFCQLGALRAKSEVAVTSGRRRHGPLRVRWRRWCKQFPLVGRGQPLDQDRRRHAEEGD